MSGLGRYYAITLSCDGKPDPTTGYLVDIHTLDLVVREQLIPHIARTCEQSPQTDPVSIMPALWELASRNLQHPLRSIEWSLTPAASITMNTKTQTNNVLIRMRYEFSASHRLHAESLDDETNRRIFGKCNNPNGHGHNYSVEPAIQIPISEDRGVSAAQIDELVEERILSELDHKHLNIDCPAFDESKGGVMPSVENIARYCYEQLMDDAERIAPGARLQSVTVWETDRTSCTYPANSA
jgi:6-pyruvoyltetrahydropterin/6-carboxytetrahydropterin synthase